MRPVARAFEHVWRTDPDTAADRARYLDERLKACRRLARRLHDEARLAPGWTVETASATFWSLISIGMLDRLLDQQGWTPDRFAKNYALLLRSAFVAAAPTGPRRRAPEQSAGESPA